MLEGFKARWQIVVLCLLALIGGLWLALQPGHPQAPTAALVPSCTVRLSEGLNPAISWSSFEEVVGVYRNGQWLTNAEASPFIDTTTPGGTFAYEVRNLDDTKTAGCGQVVLTERFRCEVQTALSLTECDALVALVLDPTRSFLANRPNRAPDPDPCRWNPVQCEDRHVVSLNLDNFDLEALASEIGDLRHLRLLQARWNQFTTIPPEIGSLTQLKFLTFRGSELADLPTEMGFLQALTDLDLSENNFVELPATVLSLTNLESLDISQNQLRTLPSELADLENLIWFDVSSNLLTDLPSLELLSLASLRQVVLSYNNIDGSISAEVLEIPKQLTLSLVGNNLSGEIPVEIIDSLLGVRIGVQSGCLSAETEEVFEWLDRYSPGWQSGC